MTAAVLACVGAALGVVLTWMPWYVVSDQVDVILRSRAAGGPAWSADQAATYDAILGAAGGRIHEILRAQGVGWELQPALWNALRLAGAGLAIVAAVVMVRTHAAGPVQRISFVVGAVVIAGGPANELMTGRGMRFMAMHDVGPAMYGSFLAAALLIGAALVANGLATEGPARVTAVPGGHGPERYDGRRHAVLTERSAPTPRP